MDEFSNLISDEAFLKTYGQIRGEKNKRIPAEFKQAHETQPLIANKYFWYSAEIDTSIITEPGFTDKLMDYSKIGKNINLYLKKALNLL